MDFKDSIKQISDNIDDKKETKYEIQSLDDIYQYSEQLKNAIAKFI
jgi:hypothetical protein